MSRKCAQCGKEFFVMYPDLYAYKIKSSQGYQFYCSWKCIQQMRKEKEEENMAGRPRMIREPEIREEAKAEEKREAAKTKEREPLQVMTVMSRVTGCCFEKKPDGSMEFAGGPDDLQLDREEWKEFAWEILQAMKQMEI